MPLALPQLALSSPWLLLLQSLPKYQQTQCTYREEIANQDQKLESTLYGGRVSNLFKSLSNSTARSPCIRDMATGERTLGDGASLQNLQLRHLYCVGNKKGSKNHEKDTTRAGGNCSPTQFLNVHQDELFLALRLHFACSFLEPWWKMTGMYLGTACWSYGQQ